MYTEELEKQLKSISDLMSAVCDQINSDAFTKTRESMAQALQPLAETMSYYFTPEYQDRMAQVAKQFGEAVKPLLNLSPKLGKVSDLIRYYNALDKTGWPLYAIEDKDLYTQITALGDNPDHEKVTAIAISYLDKGVIDEMMIRWGNSAIVDNNHFPAIREAIELYYSEKYFGCTSILACQMNGIIRDIFAHHENDTEWVEKVKLAYEEYSENVSPTEITSRKIKNSEKQQLLWATSSVESAVIRWYYITNYLYQTVYSSGDGDDGNPKRNKICHGVHFSSGTQECALKSILVIDILYRLADEIDRVYSITDNSNDNQQ